MCVFDFFSGLSCADALSWLKAQTEKGTFLCDERACGLCVGMWGGITYFHFPPLFLSLLVSRPMYVAMPRLLVCQFPLLLLLFLSTHGLKLTARPNRLC
jgi:hypothetical protein